MEKESKTKSETFIKASEMIEQILKSFKFLINGGSGDVKLSLASIKNAEKLIGYQPSHILKNI